MDRKHTIWAFTQYLQNYFKWAVASSRYFFKKDKTYKKLKNCFSSLYIFLYTLLIHFAEKLFLGGFCRFGEVLSRTGIVNRAPYMLLNIIVLEERSSRTRALRLTFFYYSNNFPVRFIEIIIKIHFAVFSIVALIF